MYNLNFFYKKKYNLNHIIEIIFNYTQHTSVCVAKVQRKSN